MSVRKVCDCCERPQPEVYCKYFITDKKPFSIFSIESWYEGTTIERFDLCEDCCRKIKESVIKEAQSGQS